MLPNEVRVSHLEQFRIWRTTEELDLKEWLLPRILDQQLESPEMHAGTVFHSALEQLQGTGDITTLVLDKYRFDFNCDIELELPRLRELEFAKQYGDVLVTGHVDGILGTTVIDYKTTQSFDADRYMESYQWRFYLDLSDCDQFLYQIFVLKPFGPENCFSVVQSHKFRQYRYPGMREDCEQLVRDYRQVVIEHQELVAR